ncbi:MAG: Gfo/Idh/MocA family protein [Dehalococcoidia bacterium]
MAEPLEAVVIGAGLRGRDTYGAFALANPTLLRIVAVAEPDDERRAAFAHDHGLPPDRCFPDWRLLLERPALARVAIIATPDNTHAEPALAALAAGYDVLLEKPIAPEPVACLRVVQNFDAAGRLLQIGHCLRYAPFYSTIYDVIASGRLGDVMTIAMAENVAWWHMAHSFVRGKFRTTATSAPMLIAKSCHDLDLMTWFIGRPCSRVASFGSLRHFRPEQAPAGAPERCTDGCPVEESCLFSALRFYLRPHPFWPWSDVSLTPDIESRRRGLETGPYGRCVYRAGNDVVDHQVVCLEFEGGVTGTFVMHGFAAAGLRTIRVSGTGGELVGAFEEGDIRILSHAQATPEHIRVPYNPFGHGGGDEGLLHHFVQAVRRNAADELLASGRASLESHLIGFAAERSRLEGQVVTMADFRAAVRTALSSGQSISSHA